MQTTAAGATQSAIYSNTFVGAGSLIVKSDTNYTVTLSGNNSSYTGGVYIAGGTAASPSTLVINSANSLGSGALTFGSSSTDYTALVATTSMTIGNNILAADTNAIVTATGNTTTLTHAIGSYGSLIADGGGTLVLSGANTYSGADEGGVGTVICGTTRDSLCSADNNGSGGLAPTTASTLQVGVNTVGSPGSITSSAIGTGTLTLDGGILQSGGAGYTIANAAQITANGGTIDAKSNTFTYSGVIANATGATGALAVTSSTSGGTVVLSNTNTYTGATSVGSGATLKLGVNGAISDSSGVNLVTGATLDATTAGATIVSLAGSGGTASLAANTLTLTNASGTFAGAITGSGGALAVNGGTETLTGTNTYTGATSVGSGATLKLGVNNAIATSSGVNLVAGATLDATTAGATIASLAGSGGTASLAANTLTLTNASGTFAGAITGSGGALAVNGGTETLTGTNTYSGQTSVGLLAGLIVDTGGSITQTSLVAVNGSLAIQNSASGTAGSVSIFGGGLTVGNIAGTSGSPNASSVTITSGGSLNFINPSNSNISLGNAAYANTTLLVSAGGMISGSSDVQIGSADNETSNATVTGSGSSWEINHQLIVGNGGGTSGVGTLTVSAGGLVNADATYAGQDGAYPTVGNSAGSSGTLTVTGTGSEFETAYTNLVVGQDGTAVLNVAAGGTVSVGSGVGTINVANNADSTGTVNIGAASGSPAAAAGTIDASTIAFGAGTGKIVFNITDTNYTFAPTIQGAGSVEVDAGTTTFTANNTYSGVTTINGGTLKGGVANAFSDNSALIVNTTGTADLNGYNQTILSLTGAGTVTDSGAAAVLTINGGVATTFSGAMTGSTALTLTGAGTGLTLSGAGLNTYSGATTVGDGTTASTLTGGATNAFSNNSALTVAAASTVDLGGFGQAINSLAGGGTVTDSGAAATLTIDGGAATIFSGAITGANTGLTLSGAGTGLTLTGAGLNTYSGATTVGDGSHASTLTGGATNAFSNSSALTIAAASTVNLNGFGQSIKSLAGAGTMTGTAAAATLTIDGGVATTFSGAMTGSTALTLTGAGTGLTLSGAGLNTYSGATTVGDGANASTLTGGANNVFSASSVTTINLASTLSLGGFSETINTLNLAGGTLTNGTLAGAIGSTGGTVNGIAGTASLTTTSGTTTLTGTNAYTGATNVNGGTLLAGAAGAFAPSSAVTVASGGTVGLNSFSQTIGSLAGAGAVTLGSATLTAGGNNASTAFSGGISGTGGLTKAGTGVFTLSGANSYTGATNVSAGTLQGGAAGAFAPSSAFTVASGATLALNSFNQTIGSLAGAGNVTLGAATLTAGGNNSGTTFSGGVSGSGGFTKAGSGKLILSGTSSYTGATNIVGGTLEVDGAITSSSNVTVGANGTLSGTGTVDPNTVTISSGATFAPGNGVPSSSMTIAGNLAFQSGAIYMVVLNPSTSSFANVTGTASLNGTVNASFASGSYLSKQYTILESAGLTGTFSGLTNTNLPTGFSDTLTYTPDNVLLNLTAQLGLANPANGLTGNPASVATALNSYFNNGGVLPAQFVPLFGLTGSSLGSSLSQLTGEVSTDAERGAFTMMNQFLGLMLNPFVDGRSGAGWPTGGGSQALGYAPEQPASFPADAALGYDKAPKSQAEQSFDQRWSAWGSGFGGANRTNGAALAGTNNVTADDYGYAAGLDYHQSPDNVLGFALAGGGTHWDLAQGLGSGSSDAFQAGVYGAGRSGPFYLATALAFANHWMTTNRIALSDQLTAKFNGVSLAGRIEGGYRWAPLQTIGFTPYAALQLQSFHTPSYSETDLTAGGFGLSYNAMSATDTRSEIGARFDAMTMLGVMPVSLRSGLAYAHDWVSNPALGAVFEALPGASFTVNGAKPPANSGLASAGAELHFTPNWSLSAKFNGEFASGSQTYAGTGTLRYTW